jgi:tetratricopeptide (TPR) repeat protein
LIRTESDTHVWARSYDGDLRDVLGFESQVAHAIAREVAVQLGPGLDSHTRPVSAEAYELYLKGRYFWNQRSPDSLVKATDYFRRVIEKDPAYAPAYAGLADACDLRAIDSSHPMDLLAQAKAAATKATQLDDRLPEAHTSLAGEKVLGEWDWAGADREFQRALAIDPRYAPAHHWYATLYLAPLGRIDEAIAEAKKAVDLDPLSLIYNTDLGWMYALDRRYDLAEARLKPVLEMDPNFMPALFRLAGVYEARGMYRETIALWVKSATQLGDPSAAAAIERAYAAFGHRGALLTKLRGLRLVKGTEPGYHEAALYLGVGEQRQALDALRSAFARHDPPMIFLKVDPSFDQLHADPGFQALERGIGLER